MRRTISAAAIVAALTAIPMSTAFATTPPDDPNDVTQVDNPADENDSSGFDDWGLLRPPRAGRLGRPEAT